MSPTQWVKRTNAIGIMSKGGKYSIGTYAHPDIVFEFASWLSPEFKLYLITELTDVQTRQIYASEADVLNVALFGLTAKEWRDNHPNLDGNIRDYTDIIHLIILSNLESINAELIKSNKNQKERLIILNETAKNQLRLLINNRSIEVLEKLNNQDNS